jgi:hypothetical protein
MEWENCLEPVGGVVPRTMSTLSSVTGDLIFEGGDAIRGDNPRSPLDYFMAMLPPDALMHVLTLTFGKLQGNGKLAATAGEILKFFIWHLLSQHRSLSLRRLGLAWRLLGRSLLVALTFHVLAPVVSLQRTLTALASRPPCICTAWATSMLAS